VIVAALDAATNQFPTVNLDCAGTLTGWQPVGTKGKYQFTRLDLSTGNFQGQNACNNGVHGIKASLEGAPPGDAAAFGLTVWGWGSGATLPCTTEAEGSNAEEVAKYETNPNYTCWVSYAYPAGVNLAKLNDVFVPAN
jgi:IgGFc binding protein